MTKITWKHGDRAQTKAFDTKKWNKVTVRPYRSYGMGSHPCHGLDCTNVIKDGALHGSGNSLHVCLDCCVPMETK